jgi:hypothetical protein
MSPPATTVRRSDPFEASRLKLLNSLTAHLTIAQVIFTKIDDKFLHDVGGVQHATSFFGQAVALKPDIRGVPHYIGNIFFCKASRANDGYGILSTVVPDSSQLTFAQTASHEAAFVPHRNQLIAGFVVPNTTSKRSEVPYRMKFWSSRGDVFRVLMNVLRGGARFSAGELRRQLCVPNAAGPDDLFALVRLVAMGHVDFFVEQQRLEPRARLLQLSAPPLEFATNVAVLLRDDAMKAALRDAAGEDLAADIVEPRLAEAIRPLATSVAGRTKDNCNIVASVQMESVLDDFRVHIAPIVPEQLWHAGLVEPFRASAPAAVATAPVAHPPYAGHTGSTQSVMRFGYGYTQAVPNPPPAFSDSIKLPDTLQTRPWWEANAGSTGSCSPSFAGFAPIDLPPPGLQPPTLPPFHSSAASSLLTRPVTPDIPTTPSPPPPPPTPPSPPNSPTFLPPAPLCPRSPP